MPQREVEAANEVEPARGERIAPLLPHLFVVLSGDHPLA
jgi:hypothetical protein